MLVNCCVKGCHQALYDMIESLPVYRVLCHDTSTVRGLVSTEIASATLRNIGYRLHNQLSTHLYVKILKWHALIKMLSPVQY